jgi:hypothetical protein
MSVDNFRKGTLAMAAMWDEYSRVVGGKGIDR